MRTHKLKVVLVTASILALGAGVFAGMAVSRLPTAVVPVSTALPPDHASIADELKLTPAQRDQMRSIWESVRGNVHQTFDRAQQIQRERDAAVVALLTDSQKAQYAALTQQAAEQFAALSAQRDKAFHEGVAQTRKMLDDNQRQTYDRIIRDRVGPSTDSVGGNASGSVSVGNGLTPPSTEPVAH